MVKKLKIMIAVLSVTLVSLIIMLIYGVNCLGTPLKQISVKIDGETTKEVKVELSDLYPDKTIGYDVELEGKNVEDFNVSLQFGGDKSNVLCSCVNVIIKTEDKEVRSGLKELVNDKRVDLGKNVKKIKIYYIMPKDVGNEAQGADMDLVITIKAETIQRQG